MSRQNAPMAWIALPFALGIVLAEGWLWRCTPWGFLIPLPLIALVLFLLWMRHCANMWISLSLLVLFWLSAGCGYTLLRALPRWPVAARSEKTTFRFFLESAPLRTPFSNKAVGRMSDGQRVMLYFPREVDTLCYADSIEASLSLSVPRGSENPSQFDYGTFLRRKGIGFQAYLSEDDFRRISSGADCRSLMALSQRCRLHFAQILRRQRLSPSQLGVAEALVLGSREDLSQEQWDRFRASGIVHILCVSGLHVGLIVAIVNGLLFFLGKLPWQRRLKGFITLLAVWAFAFLSGLAPATLRAAVMFSFFVVAQMLERPPSPFNTIAAAALCLLVYRPLMLFDVGFQLSFSAVLGIAAFYKLVEHLLPETLIPDSAAKSKRVRRLLEWLDKGAHLVWDTLCLTVVAQVSTLPLQLYYFHTFPYLFVIANLLVVPLVGLMVGLALAVLCLGWWPWLQSVAVALLALLLRWADGVASWVAAVPWGWATQIPFDGWMLLLVLSVLVCLALVVRRGWLRGIPVACSLLLLLVGYDIYANAQSEKEHCVLYCVRGHTAFEYFCGHESVLLADAPLAAAPEALDYQSQGALAAYRTSRSVVVPWTVSFAIPDTTRHCSLSRGMLRAGGRSLLLLTPATMRFAPPSESVDYLVVSENAPVCFDSLRQFYRFDTLVITRNNSYRFARALRRSALRQHIPLLDQRESNAALEW